MQSRDEATQVGEGRRAGLEPLEQQRVIVVAGVEQLHRCARVLPEPQRGGFGRETVDARVELEHDRLIGGADDGDVAAAQLVNAGQAPGVGGAFEALVHVAGECLDVRLGPVELPEVLQASSPMSAARTDTARPSRTRHVHTAARRTSSPWRRPVTCPITITEPGTAR